MTECCQVTFGIVNGQWYAKVLWSCARLSGYISCVVYRVVWDPTQLCSMNNMLFAHSIVMVIKQKTAKNARVRRLFTIIELIVMKIITLHSCSYAAVSVSLSTNCRCYAAWGSGIVGWLSPCVFHLNVFELPCWPMLSMIVGGRYPHSNVSLDIEASENHLVWNAAIYACWSCQCDVLLCTEHVDRVTRSQDFWTVHLWPGSYHDGPRSEICYHF